jgi:hypothetical protein
MACENIQASSLPSAATSAFPPFFFPAAAPFFAAGAAAAAATGEGSGTRSTLPFAASCRRARKCRHTSYGSGLSERTTDAKSSVAGEDEDDEAEAAAGVWTAASSSIAAAALGTAAGPSFMAERSLSP